MSVIRNLNIIKLESTDSTNNYATAILTQEKCTEGTVIVADEQLHGKGQKNNSWESEKGKNLLTSVVLIPSSLPIQHQFEISKVIALAVFDVVNEYATMVSIKWPNDIYVGDKKIAGILIENAIMGNEITRVVAGIGLNINQVKFISDAPNPTSLAILTGNLFDRDTVLMALLKKIDYWYSQLYDEKENIDNYYIQRLYKFQVVSEFSDNTGMFSGVITGVNQYGHLIVKKANGEVCSYGFKEVTYL